MSTNSISNTGAGGNGAAGSGAGGGSDGGGAARAPRLHAAGGYSAWRPLMEIFLRRVGVMEKDYKVANERWAALVVEVARWSAEEEDSAIALVLGGAASKGKDSSSKATLTDVKLELGDSADALAAEARIRAARRLAHATVERGERAFYYLLMAMPEALHPLVRSVPQGYAFGLWDFLEKRFQNTEDDNVADLFRRWNDLAQGEDESFDAYKARVDEVHTLLSHAKERPSVRQYCFSLLDKLQPRYKQAVLALKASGQLKDADKIGWDSVVAFINTHERSEQRLTDGADGERNMAARGLHGKPSYCDSVGQATTQAASQAARTPSAGSRKGPPRTLSDVQCFSCGQFGHLSRQCTARPKSGSAPGQKRSRGGRDGGKKRAGGADAAGSSSSSPSRQPSGEHASAVLKAGPNRFDAISSDDDDGSDDDDDSRPSPSAGSAVAAAKESVVKERTYSASAPQKAQARQAKRAASAAAETVASSKDAGSMDLGKALATTAWGVDTMASVHCSGNRSLFTSLQRCTPMSVELADGSVVTAAQCGTVQLRMRKEDAPTPKSFCIAVEGVYYHESFAANLLSMVRLAKQG